MKKTFILDTNVVLHEAESIFKFEEHDVVIPNTVIEEVDKFKKNQDETGRNARRFTRYLDELRVVGPMTEGIPLNGEGGRLFVNIYTSDMAVENLDMSKPDNRILAVAFSYKDTWKVELVTKDVNLRVMAGAFGIRASDYEHEKIKIETLYTGWREVVTRSAEINELYTNKYLPVEKISQALYPNEFVILRSIDDSSQTAICRYNAKARSLVPVRTNFVASGLSPRNVEQSFALDMLLNDDIKIVTLVGKAGTGKTLLALAAGLQKVMDEFTFRKMLVSRPVFPMGKDIGFLPGDVNEKLAPWMQPIYDNLEYLLSDYSSQEKPGRDTRKRTQDKAKGGGKQQQARTKRFEDDEEKDIGKYSKGYKELIDHRILEVEPLMYIRGRSIPKQYMIVDEAQNLTPHEVKTIVTRAGEGTKIILTGDPYQIDNPFLDSESNGLTYVVEKFKDQAIAGHITLTKGERSELAEIASNIL